MTALHVLWDVAMAAGAWFVSVLGAALARAAIEGGILLIAVGIVMHVFPRIPAAARTALWWLACGKLLLALAPHAALAIAPRGSALAEPAQWASARIAPLAPLAPWIDNTTVLTATTTTETRSECEQSCKDK